MAIFNMIGSGGGGAVEIKDWLCFTANTAGSTIQLTKTGTPTDVTLETSTDGSTWTTYIFGDTITLSNIGDKVYFRNTSETDTGFSGNGDNYYKFVMVGSIAGSGDTNYLLNKNSTLPVSSWCYQRLFYGCTSLTSAPKLPATTLASYCYYSMFYGCTSLTSAPELPATTLADSCYFSMFQGCTNLRIVSSLPATTLASSCYRGMFWGCNILKSIPSLPATTLASGCYNDMFRDCTSLTSVPTLPATTLASACYYSMFRGCTNLRIVPSLPAITLTDYCYSYMFYGCTNLERITNLPATTLTTYCYRSMFEGCSNIKISTSQTGAYQTAFRIPKTGTGTTASDALTNMFTSTGGTFTGTPTINTTYYTSNALV